MLSERLHQARQANGLSLRALAEQVGVSVPKQRVRPLPELSAMCRSRAHALRVARIGHSRADRHCRSPGDRGWPLSQEMGELQSSTSEG